MSTTTTPPRSQEDAGKQVPGWRRVLDAFMFAKDKTLTNVELGRVPGVQAFHQRISDLGRKGYIITPAVKVAQGRYAYTLVGVAEDVLSDAPYVDRLTRFEEEWREFVEVAVERIKANADQIVKRSEAKRLPRATRDVLADLRGEAADVRTHLEDLRAAIDPMSGTTPPDWSLTELAEAVTDEALKEIKHLRARLKEAKPSARRAPSSAPREHRPGGPDMMRKVLEEADAPMHSKEIARRVLVLTADDPLYNGKTPDATMAAQLSTSNKEGGQFERTEPGCFALREWSAEQKAKPAIRSEA